MVYWKICKKAGECKRFEQDSSAVLEQIKYPVIINWEYYNIEEIN